MHEYGSLLGTLILSLIIWTDLRKNIRTISIDAEKALDFLKDFIPDLKHTNRLGRGRHSLNI